MMVLASEPVVSDVTSMNGQTEVGIKNAICDHIGKNFLISENKVNKHLEIKKITLFRAYHYEVETFYEKKQLNEAFEPHYPDDPVDGPDKGTPINPKTILVNPTKPFDAEERHLKIPHTDVVRVCYNCKGSGNTGCKACWGFGKTTCTNCGGRRRSQ